MGNATAGSRKRKPKGYNAVDQNKVFYLNGKKEIEVDNPVGVIKGVSQKNPKDSPGSSDSGNCQRRGKAYCADSGPDTSDKKVLEKEMGTPGPFQFTAEHVKGQKVEKHMKKIAVEKNIRDKLPEEEILPHQGGDKTKNQEHLVSRKKLLEKYHSRGNKNGFYYRSKRSAERHALVRIRAHKYRPLWDDLGENGPKSRTLLKIYFIYGEYFKE